MGTTEGQQRGPAWYDVHVALGVLERTYDLRARFEIGRVVATRGRDQGLSLVLVLEHRQKGTATEELPAVWSAWPHVDHKTMPGLMLKMLHKATNMLEEQREELQKTAQGQLPF